MKIEPSKRDFPSMDVLIVGAGPVGYMAAVTLARYNINFRIIDKRALPVQTGHASGLQPRTQEIFHTMGIVNKLTAQAGQARETAFWGPDANGERDVKSSVNGAAKSGITRTSVGVEITNATPYPCACVNHQGNVEATFDDELRKREHIVQRPVELLHYEYTDECNHPIRVHVKDRNTGAISTWQCRYLFGSDGAASVSRRVAGISSQRHDSQDHWAVADVLLETNFPDFHRRCAIQTKHGNVMLIPSPNNTVRIYMLLSKEDVEELETSMFEAPSHSTKPRTNNTTILGILERRIPDILHPYTMTIASVDWISRYTIAQRIIESFTDGRNVYLLGDACHTHSPQAGQGMNIGMQDAYNLTWKLALVLKGHAKQNILETYNLERKHIAEQLIDFDTKFAKMFGAQRDVNAPEFHGLWEESHGFTSGCGHRYPPGLLVDGDVMASVDDKAEAPLTPGKRLVPMQLIRHIDGWIVNILDDMPSNGRFHLVIFAGDLLASQTREREFTELYQKLSSSSSVLYRYCTLPEWEASKEWDYEDIMTRSDQNDSKIVDLSVVHTCDHLKMDLLPRYTQWKYRFYEDEGGKEHKRRGVRTDGLALELVRPDGVVGMVCGGDLQRIEQWMDGFMVIGET
jgi:phenol 2-monooxygenase